MSGARRVGLGALLVAASASAVPLGGQEIEAGVAADTVRVGDVVPVVVRVTVAPDERVLWPDTLPLDGTPAENATRVREQVDTLADGRLTAVGAYGVTPWRTGDVALPEVVVQVARDESSTGTHRVMLPVLTVSSVLPSDTSGLEPRPARGVLGANWAWGRILLMALLVAGVLAGLLWWWRRGAEEEAVAVAPPIPPRERALALLQEAREAGLLEQGAVKEFYTRLSDAVRGYLAALSGTWGEDLTTTELLARFRAQVGPSESAALRDVLAPADQVKFARREPDRETAIAEWEAVRGWVRDFDWPPPRQVRTEEAA